MITPSDWDNIKDRCYLDRIFDIAARAYWQHYLSTGDYAQCADYIRTLLTDEERRSERFEEILNKRKPATY